MSYQTLFENALNLHEAGRLDEAATAYRQILETAPNQPDVLNLLGLVAQSKGLQSEAISLFLRAIKEKPSEISFRYNLAFSYKSCGKWHDALEAFGVVLYQNATIKEAHNEIGLIYQQLKNYEQACQHFQLALDIDVNYAEARINKVMNLRYFNVHQALDGLEKLIPLYGEEALLWFYLAQLYMETKNWPEAWKAAVKTKELASTSDEVRVMLGELSLLENDDSKAKIYFSKAELLNPDNLTALLRLADIYSREGDFEAAEKKYKRVLELDKNNFEAHQNYAEMLYRAKRTSESLEEYRNAVILNPNSADVCNNLALVLKDLEDYGQAADLLLNAFKLNPNLAEISINLSETITLLVEQDKNLAKNIVNCWLELDKDNVFAKKLEATLEGKSFEDNHLYTEKLFDHFADNYELVMQNLGYSAQVAVARAIGNDQAVIVDLGCGTGLLGEVLEMAARHLIGVDISQKMLDKAKQKGIYDELIKDDIKHFLQSRQDFDVAVLGDVCGYLSNLNDVIKLLKNKKIILTIEVSDKEQSEVGSCGRYKYNPNYIGDLFRENGFENIHKEGIVLRKEFGQDVKGMIFRVE